MSDPSQTAAPQRIYSLAALPPAVFAARHDGLYRSTDGCKTWEDTRAAPLPITFVAAAPLEQHAWVFAAAADGRILRSPDRGQTWESAALDLPAPRITAIAVSPEFAGDGLLLAATMQDGVYRSGDRGASWTGWNFGLYDPHVNALVFAGPQRVVAGTQSGVFVSANGGRSWRETGFPPEQAPVLCVAAGPDQSLLAGAPAAGLLISRDAGKTWQALFDGSVEHIRVDGERIYILAGGRLLVSEHGRPWQPCLPEVAVSAFTASPLVLGLENGEVVGA